MQKLAVGITILLADMLDEDEAIGREVARLRGNLFIRDVLDLQTELLGETLQGLEETTVQTNESQMGCWKLALCTRRDR